jgi:hypothetical protein
MNILRMAYASLAAFLAYFVVGGLMFVLIPSLKKEFGKYPAVYRGHEGQMRFMPLGMVGMLVAIVALTAIYAMLSQAAPASQTARVSVRSSEFSSSARSSSTTT